MSFVTEEDVISTVERVIARVAKEVLPNGRCSMSRSRA